MSELSLFDVLRPFLWVAAIAFTIGFAAYAAVNLRTAPAYAQATAPAEIAVSAQSLDPKV